MYFLNPFLKYNFFFMQATMLLHVVQYLEFESKRWPYEIQIYSEAEKYALTLREIFKISFSSLASTEKIIIYTYSIQFSIAAREIHNQSNRTKSNMQHLFHLNLEFKTECVDNLKLFGKTGLDIHDDFKIELENSLIAKFFKITIS